MNSNLGGRVYLVAIDPSDPTTLFAAVAGGSRYTSGPADGIYRSRDAGETWTRVYVPPKGSQSFGTVTALSVSGSRVVAGVDVLSCVHDLCFQQNGTPVSSANGGSSWGNGAPAIRIRSFAFDPLLNDVVYAGAVASGSIFGETGGGGAYRSTDGGRSWASSRGIGGRNIGSLAIDPADGITLYAGSGDGGIFKSIDGATTWELVASGFDGGPVNALVVDPVNRNTVYAGTSAGVFRSDDGGLRWRSVGQPGASSVTQLLVDPADHRTVYAGSGGQLFALTFEPTPCKSGPTTLCLNNGRFQTTVSWRRSDGSTGEGRARPGTSDTGYFWFFDEANLELAVKVIDGTSLGGYFWVFGGSLSDVEYTLTISDSQTGAIRSYHHPQGTLSSFADTAAFPATGGSSVQTIENSAVPSISATAYLGQAEVCAAFPTVLCVNGGRFKVDVSWRTEDGRSGAGPR